MSYIKNLTKQKLIYLILALIALSIINTLFVPEGFLRGLIFGFSTVYMIFAIISLVKKLKK